MAFTVRFSGQPQPENYGDDDGFEFLEGGVLAIHFDDEEKRAEFYPPAKWEQVSADPDHLAGLNTPYVEDEDGDYDGDGEEFDDEDYEDDEEDYGAEEDRET
jgi:hypothetical protein